MASELIGAVLDGREIAMLVEKAVRKTEGFLTGAVVAGGLGLAVLAGVATFVRQHVRAQAASGETAGSELAHEASRFTGQRPLREVQHGLPPMVRPLGQRSAEPGQRLRALIADVRLHRVVRVELPLAGLRVAKRGGFRYLGELTPLLDDTEFDADRVDRSLEDLDRRGPILLVDHSHADGARILVWLE